MPITLEEPIIMMTEDSNIDPWIASYLEGNLSKEDFKRLEQWTMESDTHRKYVRDRIELWFSSAVTDSSDFPDEAQAFARFSRRVHVTENKAFVASSSESPNVSRKLFSVSEMRSWRSTTWKLIYRVAAVVLIILLPLTGYFKGQQTVKQTFADIIVEASPGTSTKLTLPDGTLVWLNAGSKIVYSQGFGMDDRIVELSGEGYFEVKKNIDMPFEVHTPEVNLQVLGTKFNFRNYADDKEVIVSLMEGKVALKNRLRNQSNIYLSPNERMRMNKSTGVMVASKARVESSNLWKNNQLFFDEELLEDIAKSLMRSYDVKIKVTDSLRNSRFYGDFTLMKHSIDDVLTTLAETGRMHVKKIENGKYLIY